MTGYLLGTNAALLALAAPHRLSVSARRAVSSGTNVISVVSYWEVLLKSMKGNLDVGDPREWWKDSLDQLAARPLTLQPAHVTAVYGLPSIHRDPFDRMLIAQAIAEDLSLVTVDRELRRYSAAGLRFVG